MLKYLIESIACSHFDLGITEVVYNIFFFLNLHFLYCKSFEPFSFLKFSTGEAVAFGLCSIKVIVRVLNELCARLTALVTYVSSKNLAPAGWARHSAQQAGYVSPLGLSM